MAKTASKVYYFNSEKRHTVSLFSRQLLNMLKENDIKDREIVILCIGSDRSTGDSLGPLIGHKLSRYNFPGITVYGTLSAPVHAVNLEEKINMINNNHFFPFIIAIDASLGTMEHVGFVTIGQGPLKPGLGVNKTLPSVGDIHITGIVNFSGMMESLLLQTTRLSKVMSLADMITKGLLGTFMDYYDYCELPS